MVEEVCYLDRCQLIFFALEQGGGLGQCCSAPALGANLSGPVTQVLCKPWPRVRNVLMPAGLGPLKAPSSCVRGKSWVPVEEQMLQPAWSSVREVLTTWKGSSLNYS